MRLRYPCKEHERYDAHEMRNGDICPGGEFLAGDALRLAIEAEVVAWCPNLNAYAKASFVDNLMKVLGVREGAL